MITTCPKCGKCYEEQSEEEANSPSRECMDCWGKARTKENLRRYERADDCEWNSDPHNRRVNP